MKLRTSLPILALALGMGSWSCKERTSASSAVREGDDGGPCAPLDAEAASTTDKALAKINCLITNYQQNVPEDRRHAYRQRAWAFMNLLDQRGVLDDVLNRMFDALPPQLKLNEEQKKSYAAMVYGFLKVEIDNRETFASWDVLNRQFMEKVNATQGMDMVQALQNLAFVNSSAAGGAAQQQYKSDEEGAYGQQAQQQQAQQGQQRQQGSTEGLVSFLPVGASSFKLLENGPKSWPERVKLIQSAKNNLWIFCWAFYNDRTGNEGADVLIAKARAMKSVNPNFEIRIVTDGPTQSKPGYAAAIDKIIDTAAGEGLNIQVIRWSHPEAVGYGMHRKVFIVDHNTGGQQSAAVFGGMNYGDNYSHRGVDMKEIDKWRDTDMMVTGEPVKQAAAFFARAWNNFVDRPGTPGSSENLTKVATPALPRVAGSNGSRFAFVDQDPISAKTNPGYLDPVYLITLKMIESAQRGQTVDISNAYFITTLPIEEALVRAANRGAIVRIHTNANESLCDEDKPLLGPIYGSLRKLLEASNGKIKVYLQKDHTLHSKYMIVNGQYGWLGSYNIHPRSARYEGESVGMFVGGPVADAVKAQFEKDILPARSSEGRLGRPGEPGSVVLPPNALGDLVAAFFFEQL